MTTPARLTWTDKAVGAYATFWDHLGTKTSLKSKPKGLTFDDYLLLSIKWLGIALAVYLGLCGIALVLLGIVLAAQWIWANLLMSVAIFVFVVFMTTLYFTSRFLFWCVVTLLGYSQYAKYRNLYRSERDGGGN